MKTVSVLLGIFAMSSAFAGQFFFEELAPRHIMPSEVRATVRAMAAEGIRDCQKQLDSTNEQTEDYFTAIPFGLSPQHAEALLVLPTLDCPSFSGAHAINFWLFLVKPTPRLVLSGAQDMMEIQKSTSNGLFNIVTYYGTDPTHYQYDGKNYVAHRGRRSN